MWFVIIYSKFLVICFLKVLDFIWVDENLMYYIENMIIVEGKFMNEKNDIILVNVVVGIIFYM